MRTTLLLLTFVVIGHLARAQEQPVNTSDLSVPTSPAFGLVDIAPSLIQTPAAPKAFVLSVLQSYQESGGGFPQNYSAEFAPYWWFKTQKRSVFSFLGFKTDDLGKPTSPTKQDVFAGFKFTTVSFALMKKDLIPDNIDNAHKVASAGFRTTFLRVQRKEYVTEANKLITEWHKATLMTLSEEAQDASARGDTAALNSLFLKDAKVVAVSKKLSELIAQKPIFSWELAGAYASYGINDTDWQMGRAGVWTTASLNLSLADCVKKKCYFSIHGVGRYIQNDFFADFNNNLGKATNIDLGFKLALEFKDINVAYEGFKRYVDGQQSSLRSVGVINYRVAQSVYLNGAFGKNFSGPDPLVALFGINWGIGSEALKLPIP